MDRSDGPQGWIASPAMIAGLFVLALSPLLVDHLLFHPDERHYVDGALQMQATGDWLTPRTAEGDLRLRKPILPYWFAAAGMSLAEPSPFTSRVLFLLAGGGIIWWGARAAREATGSAPVATMTALILACHPVLILAATRSLPDVILGLFLTVSLAGFVRIIARGRADWGPLLTAYLGGALAILAKGSPAIVFVGYGTAYIAVRKRTLFLSQWRRFGLAGAMCILVGGSWFAVMQWRHGDELTRQFVVDQGHPYRFAENALQVASQSVLSVLLLATCFGLMLFPSLRSFWTRRSEVVPICRRSVNEYVLGWIMLFLGCAACINHVSPRYLLPATPPAAILLAGLMIELDGPRIRRNLRGLAWISWGLVPVAGLLFVVVRWSQAPTETLLATALAAAGTWRLFRQMRFTGITRGSSVVTAAVLLMLLTLSWAGVAASGRSFGYRLADALAAELGTADTDVTLIGKPAHASRVRVCSGGKLRVRQLYEHEIAAISESEVVAALNPDDLRGVSAKTVLPVACGLEDVRLGDAWEAFQAGRLSEYIDSHRRYYYVAIRPSGRQPAVNSVATQPDAASITR